MVTFDRLEITPDGKHLIIDARVNSMPYFEDLGIEGVYINSDLDFLESGLKEDSIIYSKSFTEGRKSKLAVYVNDKTLIGYLTDPTFYTDRMALSYYKGITADKFKSESMKIAEVAATPEGENIIGFLDTKYPNSKFYVKTGDMDISNLNAVDGFVLPVHSKEAYPKHIRIAVSSNEIVNGDIKDFSSNLFFVFIKVCGTPSDCTPCGMDSEYTMGATFSTTLLYQKALSYIRELGSDCKIPKRFIDFILQFEALKACIETDRYIEAVKYFHKMFKGMTASISSGCGCSR